MEECRNTGLMIKHVRVQNEVKCSFSQACIKGCKGGECTCPSTIKWQGPNRNYQKYINSRMEIKPSTHKHLKGMETNKR